MQETLGGVTAVSLGELVRPRAGIYTVRTRPVAQACRGQSSRGQPSREDDARQALAWVLPPEQGRGDRLYLARALRRRRRFGSSSWTMSA